MYFEEKTDFNSLPVNLTLSEKIEIKDCISSSFESEKNGASNSSPNILEEQSNLRASHDASIDYEHNEQG